MVLTGSMPPIRGSLIFVSQIIGAIASAGVVSALFPGQLNVRTSLGAGTSIVQGLFIEMFLTAQLVFTIFMLAAEKHKATFIAPIGIGLSLFIAELSGRSSDRDGIPVSNRNRCVLHRWITEPCSFICARCYQSFIFPLPLGNTRLSSLVPHHISNFEQIYWVGPALGSLLASGFYKFLQGIEYETANPGQDFDENETQLFDPEKDVNRPIVNVAASGVVPDPLERSKPISGDTMTNHLGQVPSHSIEPSASSSHGQPTNVSAVNGGRRGSSLPPGSENTKYLDGEPSTMYRDAPDVEAGKHYTIGDPVILHRGGGEVESERRVPRNAGYA